LYDVEIMMQPNTPAFEMLALMPNVSRERNARILKRTPYPLLPGFVDVEGMAEAVDYRTGVPPVLFRVLVHEDATWREIGETIARQISASPGR
jgi:hypothetical protein